MEYEEFREIPILLPSQTEQQAIADYLDKETARIDGLLGKKQRQIELLREKRSALITRAVTKGLNPQAPMKPSGIPWLGDIPSHWEVLRLKHLLSEPLKYGANESAEFEDPSSPRFIRITDVDSNGYLHEETFKSLPYEIAKEFLLEEGDILFARSGATVGKNFLFKKEWGICAFAGYLIRARFNKSKVKSEYLKYFANSQQYWSWLTMSFIQATIQNVNAEKYGNMLIPIPVLKEQKNIVDNLDKETARIDVLIGKIEFSIELLREYRASLISACVTGKIDVRGKNNYEKI